MTGYHDRDHSMFRITEIEYTDDGCCYVGVRVPNISDIQQFRLSNFCFRISWLRNFKHPDLESIWLLTKHHPTISLTKRIFAFIAIKYCGFEQLLQNWEEEAKVVLFNHKDDFEDW